MKDNSRAYNYITIVDGVLGSDIFETRETRRLLRRLRRLPDSPTFLACGLQITLNDASILNVRTVLRTTVTYKLNRFSMLKGRRL